MSLKNCRNFQLGMTNGKLEKGVYRRISNRQSRIVRFSNSLYFPRILIWPSSFELLPGVRDLGLLLVSAFRRMNGVMPCCWQPPLPRIIC